MRTTVKTMQVLVLSASLFAIAGCNESAPTKVKAEQAPEETRPAAVVGKPTAPIDISYEVLSSPEKGQPLQISVSVSPKVEAANLVVDLRTSDAVQMNTTDGHWQMYNQKLGQTDTRTITVVPTSDGHHEIVVHAGIEIDGVMQSRVLVIPFHVGVVQEIAVEKEVSYDEDGTAVVVLPADDQ